MTENEAMARQAMNHRKRSHDDGIRRNACPKNVSCTTGWMWRYMCLLSRFSFEKQAMAGMCIAANDRTTQKADTC